MSYPTEVCNPSIETPNGAPVHILERIYCPISTRRTSLWKALGILYFTTGCMHKRRRQSFSSFQLSVIVLSSSINLFSHFQASRCVVRHWNICQVGSNYVLLSERKHKERQMYRQKKVFSGVRRRLRDSNACISKCLHFYFLYWNILKVDTKPHAKH